MCSKPFRRGVAEYGCGQCLPCRINRRRMWCTRLMLEATQHEFSYFVTLTYAPDFYPPGGTLVLRHLQLFFKRFRKAIEPLHVRYYAVGEYGDRSSRPHYHLLLYGVPLEDHVFDRQDWRKCRCVLCASWDMGLCHTGRLEPDSVSYVVSYVVKRMTAKDDARLNGRYPEFAVMSKMPVVPGTPGGIGAGAIATMADALTSRGGARAVSRTGNVPGNVRMDGKLHPLGRYLRTKLREATGIVKQKYYRGEEPIDVKMVERQVELMREGGRELREARREATANRARALEAIKRSKKGEAL